MSLSEAAGHLSFVFLGLGFLETDVLPLRIYAAAGISCSIAFQYFRPEPLWIPFSWNAIFLAINAGMVALLLKERHDARQQGHESAALYDKVFRESGLTALDFMRIMGISETTKFAPGEVLARQDMAQEKLYLVQEGKLKVSKNGQLIATVREGDFAGEMSFLKYDGGDCESVPEGSQSTAVADVTVQPSGAKVISWDFDELQAMLSNYPNMSACFHNTLASAVASKLVDSHDPVIKYRLLLQGVLVDGVVTITEREELAKARRLMGVDDDIHLRELKAAGWIAEEFDQGYHDKPSSREYEALVRDVLRGGVVDDAGRTKLRQYRIDKGVDSLYHLRVLKKMGWTLNDLEAGRRLDRPSIPVPPPAVLPASSGRIADADRSSTDGVREPPRAGSPGDEKRGPT